VVRSHRLIILLEPLRIPYHDYARDPSIVSVPNNTVFAQVIALGMTSPVWHNTRIALSKLQAPIPISCTPETRPFFGVVRSYHTRRGFWQSIRSDQLNSLTLTTGNPRSTSQSINEAAESLALPQPASSLSAMVAVNLADAKIALQAIGGVLKASPIPDPFKSAVTAIPNLALAIIKMAEVLLGRSPRTSADHVVNRFQGAKQNQEDAQKLALYIANLCERTTPELEKRGAGNVNDDVTRGINDFTT
jgi:hypothetical protein